MQRIGGKISTRDATAGAQDERPHRPYGRLAAARTTLEAPAVIARTKAGP